MIADDRRRVIEQPRKDPEITASVPTGSGPAGRNRRLRCVLALIVVLLSLYPAWIHRYDMVNDTVSYLDMGSLFFSGHFGFIVNGTWGPLYAFLLGAWLHLVRPTPQWEYPFVHVLLFFVFLLFIVCFDAFLAALLEFRERQSADDERGDGSAALTIIGYVVFAWSALILVGVQETNPDMIVATFFLLACACTLRIHNGRAGWGEVVVLGVAVAGLFLTKPVTLPAGAVLIAAAATAGSSWRSRLRIGLAAGLLAGLLSLPYVAALSLQEGHLTISESGEYNYAVHVDNVPARNWRGETPNTGQPLHPLTQVLDSPVVFAFATPLPGTYPLWFDPSYWYAGVKAPINWSLQRIAIVNDLDALGASTFGVNCAPLAALILLQSFGLRRPRAIRRMLQYWIVWLPAAVGLVPYVLIHWEPRYIAGGLCVLMVTAIASARLPVLPQTRQIYAGAAILVTTLFFIPSGPTPAASTIGLWQAVRLHWPQQENVFWDAASALHEAGYPEGTRVATIEFGDLSHMLWARLARAQIVAEVDYSLPSAEDHLPRERGPFVSHYFWDDPPVEREKALIALKSAGAQVLVTAVAPHGPDAAQWKPLSRSGYYYRPL